MKLPLHIPLGLAVLLLTACGHQPGATTEKVDDRMQEARKDMANADDREEWMDERDDALEDMRDLRERLFNRRARIQERLNGGVDNSTSAPIWSSTWPN